MDFTQNEYSAPRKIEKSKYWGPFGATSQSSPFTSKKGQIGQIGRAVLRGHLTISTWTNFDSSLLQVDKRGHFASPFCPRGQKVDKTNENV